MKKGNLTLTVSEVGASCLQAPLLLVWCQVMQINSWPWKIVTHTWGNFAMNSWIDSGFNYFILNRSLRFSVTHSTDIYSSQIKTKNHLLQTILAHQQGKPLMQGTLTPEGISCWDSARWFSYPQLAAIQNILWPRYWLLPTHQKATTNLNNNYIRCWDLNGWHNCYIFIWGCYHCRHSDFM